MKRISTAPHLGIAVAALAAALVIMQPLAAEARGGGGGFHGGGGGGFHGGGFHGGGFHGGGFHGGGFHDGGFHGRGFHDGRFFGGGFGVLGVPYYSYSYCVHQIEMSLFLPFRNVTVVGVGRRAGAEPQRSAALDRRPIDRSSHPHPLSIERAPARS